jgi:hypothetical protein
LNPAPFPTAAAIPTVTPPELKPRKDKLMKTHSSHLSDHDRLIDAAKRRSAQLRREAVDGFWNDAGDAARNTLRSAVRLASRLARHSRLRGQGA